MKPSEQIEAKAKELREQYPYWPLESVRYHALLWYHDQTAKDRPPAQPEPVAPAAGDKETPNV